MLARVSRFVDRLTRSPLRLRGFEVPAELVLIAKLIALVSINQGGFPLFLPFFPIVEEVISPRTFALATLGLRWLGYVLLFFTPCVRVGSLLLGTIWLAGLLACQPCQSVAHTFLGCLFVVIACSSRATGARLVQAQVILLYAGAALNKGLDPDWWNGRYFETLLDEHHQVALYQNAAALLPDLWLARGLGMVTILTQALLVLLFLQPAWQKKGVLLGTFFHVGMVLVMQQTFGPFFLIVLASYLAFLTLPRDSYSNRAKNAASSITGTPSS